MSDYKGQICKLTEENKRLTNASKDVDADMKDQGGSPEQAAAGAAQASPESAGLAGKEDELTILKCYLAEAGQYQQSLD